MKTNRTIILYKMRRILKVAYWMWLVLSFLYWLHLFFVWNLGDPNGYSNFRSIFLFLFSGSVVSPLLFVSPILVLIIFMIISIARKKVSVWEFSAIVMNWGLVILVFPHLRG